MINRSSRLSKEEKELINQYDSRLYGMFKFKEKAHEYHLNLISKGIEQYETILFWKKNTSLLKSDSNYEISELNATKETSIFYHLGHLNLLIEQYPQALSAYQRYYAQEKLFWKDPIFLYGIGLVYFHFGAFDLASNAFFQALYVDPNFSRANEIHLRLGILYKIRGNLKYSLKHFQLALIDEANALSTSHAQIYFHVAHLLECRGYVKLSKQLYEKLLSAPILSSPVDDSKNKQHPQLLPNSNSDFPFLNGKNAAENRYIEVDASIKASCLRQVGWLHHNFFRLFSTSNSASSNTLIDQNYSNNQANLIKNSGLKKENCTNPIIKEPVIDKEKSENAAIRYLQSAISLDPTSGQTWYYLGRCFANLGKIHDAFISYRHSIDKSEGSADTWCSIGVLYQQQNQPMDALQAYICAIQLNKKFTPAWTNLALLYETCNMPKDALTCYANAIKAGDPNPALLPRIKKLKDTILSSNYQHLNIQKAKTALPTIEEAWNLPIPAELTSRQNADTKIPPFMTKYIYPLIQQQREMRLKLSAMGRKSLTNGVDIFNVKDQQVDKLTHRQYDSIHNTPEHNAIKRPRFSSEAPSMNNVSSADSDYKYNDCHINTPSEKDTHLLNLKQEDFINPNSNVDNDFFNDIEDEDDEDEEGLIDPAVEKELENLLALDGADTKTLFACLNTNNSSPVISDAKRSDENLLNTPNSSMSHFTPINRTSINHDMLNRMNIEANLTGTNNTAHHTPSKPPPNPVPILGDFSTPSFLFDAHDPDPTYNTHQEQNSNRDIMGLSNYMNNSPQITRDNRSSESLLAPIHISSSEIKRLCNSDIPSPSPSSTNTVPSNLDPLSLLLGLDFEAQPPHPPPHPDPPDPLNLSDISNSPIPQVPLFTVTGKKVAHSPELRQFCLSHPATLIKGLCQALKLDLGLYSTKTLTSAHPRHLIEVRAQARYPLTKNYADPRTGKRQVWKCTSTRHFMPLVEYAKYQGTSFKRALEEEKAKNSSSGDTETINENDAKNIKDCPPFRKILFGTNVDLSDEEKWTYQLQELNKLPTFLKVDSQCSNMLSHLGHTVLGMNSVQLYMKVPGCRTPGHRENLNFCSVNINIGPGDTEWFTVASNYWGALASLCSSRNVDFLKGSWWPGDIGELERNKIPFTHITQKPGDVVWINAGTVHWVQASGWCNNIAWNVGPLTSHQYELAMVHYEWNKLQHYKSLVPMVHLSWNIVTNVKITDRRLFQLLKSTLHRSLKRSHSLIRVLSLLEIPIVFHGILPGELCSHYCDKCEKEVFDILFVKNRLVHCFECARRMSPDIADFTVLKQYKQEELDGIYDNFSLNCNNLNNPNYPKLGFISTNMNGGEKIMGSQNQNMIGTTGKQGDCDKTVEIRLKPISNIFKIQNPPHKNTHSSHKKTHTQSDNNLAPALKSPSNINKNSSAKASNNQSLTNLLSNKSNIMNITHNLSNSQHKQNNFPSNHKKKSHKSNNHNPPSNIANPIPNNYNFKPTTMDPNHEPLQILNTRIPISDNIIEKSLPLPDTFPSSLPDGGTNNETFVQTNIEMTQNQKILDNLYASSFQTNVPQSSIPSHVLMRTPSGHWIKKEKIDGISTNDASVNTPSSCHSLHTPPQHINDNNSNGTNLHNT
ncbi:unnamed protein product [Gordionus sp. m RMFG-2023]